MGQLTQRERVRKGSQKVTPELSLKRVLQSQEGDGRQNVSGKGVHVQNSRGERDNSVWREPSLVIVLRVTRRGKLREESGEEEETVMKSQMGHTKEYGFHPEG